MANQTSENVSARLKREGTYGTKEGTGAGATRIRLLDSDGLMYHRDPIATEERRPDQLEGMPILGGMHVDGSYVTEVNPGGEFDLLIESLVRGTMDASASSYASIDPDTALKKVTPDNPPSNYGYTIEQYDVDIQASEVFYGCRVTQLDLAMAPRQRAKCTWNFQGLSRDIVAAGAGPWFTSPSETTGDSLIVDNAGIYYDGTQILVATEMNLTVAIAAAMQDVIGSFVSPDIFMNQLTVKGNVSMIRQDLAALQDFDDETEFTIRAVLRAPGTGARLTAAVYMPRVKLVGISAPFLGGDAAKVEQRAFSANPPAGASNVIEFYTSTDTPA